jgi:hypothetical protein
MTSVSCAELRDSYLRGERPAGAAVERHLAECEVCAALSASPTLGAWLAAPAAPPLSVDSALEARVAAALAEERGSRAMLRSLSTRARFSLVLGGCVLVTAIQLLRKAPPELGPSLWLTALGLVVTVLFLLSTARATPGWQKLLVFLIAADLPLFCSTYFEFGNAEQDPGNPLRCFAYGGLLSLPLLALLVTFERRERVPPLDWALAGAGLGLLATIVLELDCANTHPGHLMFGHVSIGWVFIVLLGFTAHLRKRDTR